MRAAWTARFSGSARYCRMYSRSRARVPSVRQGGEQNDLGLPRPAPAGSAPPQTRHLAVRPPPPAEGDDGGGVREDRDGTDLEGREGDGLPMLRRYPLLRHGSEQYLTDRLGVWNALPHAAHRTRRAREAASLSALFSHRAQ